VKDELAASRAVLREDRTEADEAASAEADEAATASALTLAWADESEAEADATAAATELVAEAIEADALACA